LALAELAARWYAEALAAVRYAVKRVMVCGLSVLVTVTLLVMTVAAAQIQQAETVIARMLAAAFRSSV